MAAFIWIFIKLPQEWWIHVAQLDFTDFMKETVFGVDATTVWGDVFGDRSDAPLAITLAALPRSGSRVAVAGTTTARPIGRSGSTWTG